MSAELTSTERATFSLLPPTLQDLTEPARQLLTELINRDILPADRVRDFLFRADASLRMTSDVRRLAEALAESGLLTRYQLQAVVAGKLSRLRLGNYRVLDQLNSTRAVGQVLLGEHVFLQRRVAIKILQIDPDLQADQLDQFHTSLRVLANLHHPHLVSTFDAGRLPAPHPRLPGLVYQVLELVEGGSLKEYLKGRTAPVPVAQACEWIRQAAAALQVAHDHHLIHRNVKPSNLLLTEHGEVKLTGFALHRRYSSTVTNPKSLIRNVEFTPPEHCLNPGSVNESADIYGLGATLFWLLTGKTPFPQTDDLEEAFYQLREGQPRKLGEFAPDIPEDLAAFVEKMLDRDPSRRPGLPITVMTALSAFAAPASGTWDPDVFSQGNGSATVSPPQGKSTGELSPPWQVAIVVEDPRHRQTISECLETLGCICYQADSAGAAMPIISKQPLDLLVVDNGIPSPGAHALGRLLRERPGLENVKILVLSDHDGPTELAEALAHGADDLLARSSNPLVIAAKVQHLLRLKDSQDRVTKLGDHLFAANRQLEESLLARSDDVRRAQDAMLCALAKMAESREGETPGHLKRLQSYSRVLAQQLAENDKWRTMIDERFLDFLHRCVPLHDIGNIGISNEILSKPGPLTAEERATMETHPIIGDDLLEAIAQDSGESFAFLGMAKAIVRHHHERWDGSGYPDSLSGDYIPPAARIVAVADVYDALRRQRSHKPAMSHTEAVEAILKNSPEQFDPDVLSAFEAVAAKFEDIYEAIPN